MDHSHIVTRFDKDLSEIESLLVEMADLVAKQIRDSAKALQLGDDKLAKTVTKNDSKINRLPTREAGLFEQRKPYCSHWLVSVRTLSAAETMHPRLPRRSKMKI